MKKNSLAQLFGRKKYILISIIILVIIAVFIINNLNKAIDVEVYTVKVGEVNDTYKENAVISLGKEYHILSKVNGSIEEVLVNENSPVKKGDILIKISSRDVISWIFDRDYRLSDPRFDGPAFPLSVFQSWRILGSWPH
mgnify:CR=1 FL=1